MNRKIKFRAWNKEKKCWTRPDEFPVQSIDDMKSWEVIIPDGLILLQYTGIKDSKGVEVFEGDIVINKLLKQKHIVKFEDGGFKLIEDSGDGDCNDFNMIVREVIGNIYENKDLLCEKQKKN